MEDKIQKAPQLNNLQISLQSIFQPEGNFIDVNKDFSVSIYGGELNIKDVIRCIGKIKKAFPSLPASFYDVFSERVRVLGRSGVWLEEATNKVIDNCIYPTPTVANFISFDETVPVFTWEQMVKKVNEVGPKVWEMYQSVSVPGKEFKVWIHKKDLEKFTP